MNTTKRDVQDEKKYYIQNMDNKNAQVEIGKGTMKICRSTICPLNHLFY